MSLAVVKSKRSNVFRTWDATVAHLILHGEAVHSEPPAADTVVVLSGQFENPLCLTGKKILFYKKQEWVPAIHSQGWDAWYSKLLCHYYDEMVDCSADTPENTLERIRCLKTAS